MGKSPMAYHGHERSRHHNYSRNSQSRNRRSENQGFAPANYIYTPDRFLRQLPSYYRGNQQRGRGASHQYFKGRSYHNRPYSTARVRSPLVQKRLLPQRKRTRQDMHPPGESEVASKSSEQLTDATKNENEPSSESQQIDDHSSNAVQASVPQTRSSTKAQQNKSEENAGANKSETEDGSGTSQSSSPLTRSSTKARSKSEDITGPDKSENEDSEDKIIRTTRGNSKVRNDDKSSSTVEVQPTEERVTGHNTRSATKAKLDVSDESEQQEEGSNVSKTRKMKKDTRTVPDTEGDTDSTHRQTLVETEKKTHTQDNLADPCQINEDLTLNPTVGTEQHAKETSKSEKSMVRNDKEATTVLANVKHLVGSKSPRLMLTQIDTHTEKCRDPSTEKETNTTAASSDIAEYKDSPRRSSRRGSSRMKIEKEETQLPSRTPRRDHSRTPVRNQQPVEQRERGDSFAASIRSISCRRSIRDSPSLSNINDSFQKQSVVKQHVQVTVKKTNKEYLSGNDLDISTEKSIDITTDSDESSVPREKIRKRKASTLETVEKDQEPKKKCTPKSEQNSSIISAVSSPLQLLSQKQEPVSSSTPLKVVECCETVHMELSEESITDESVAFEKARDSVAEPLLSFEKGAPVPEPICEPASRKWCSVM